MLSKTEIDARMLAYEQAAESLTGAWHDNEEEFEEAIRGMTEPGLWCLI